MTDPIALTENVWRLGNYHIAVFLIKGRKNNALFEVGVNAVGPLIISQLAKLGVSLSEIDYLILSHAHGDHATGQVPLAKAMPKAKLVMTPKSASHLAKPQTVKQFILEDIFIANALGLAQEDSHEISDLLPNPILEVEPGSSLDLGDLTIDFFSGDGHAPGGLAGYIPEQGVLLPSDSAGFYYASEDCFPLFFVSYEKYMQDLDSMVQLKPKIVALSHQNWFKGEKASQYLQKVKSLMSEQKLRIKQEIQRGKSIRELARDLSRRYYKDELTIYSPEGINYCCELLIKRSLEAKQTTLKKKAC